MVARATLAEVDLVRSSPDAAIERFKASVVPALREQEGYEGLYVLLSADGKVLVLSFWSSDETAQASRLSGFYAEQIAKFEEFVFYRAEPGREAYDVVVADTPERVAV